MKKLELHKIFFETSGSKEEQKDHLLYFLTKKFKCFDNPEKVKVIKSTLEKNFYNKYFVKWQECCRINDRFLLKNETWLNGEINFIFENPAPSTSGPIGRRPVAFVDSSERTKRRKVSNLRSEHEVDELSVAASMSLRSQGNEAGAKLFKEVTYNSPDRAKKILSAWKNANKTENAHGKYTPEEALSLLISNNFTKRQYRAVYSGAKSRNCNMYPPYNQLLNSKAATYPPDIFISETKCEVPLQSLLNNTCERLFKVLNLPELDPEGVNYMLVCKYGFDGSSGHSNYKQAWNELNVSDESLFLTALVPLKLQSIDRQKVVWENPRLSSTRFCRPVRMQWVRETTEIAKQEKDWMDKQILELQPYIDMNRKVSFSIQLTMIDGKVVNALSDTSSMTCNVCHLKISQLNNLDLIFNTEEDDKAFELSLPILHSYIHFMECLLNISYRLEFKTWKATEKDGTKKLMEIKKNFVQKKFLSELSLRVSFPKPGYGSSNDGNTARKFFQYSAKSAEITGIDEALVKRFHYILVLISCGCSIDYSAFQDYCTETVKLYISLYPWYYMPPTVHKILIHSASFIKKSIVPFGCLSEEVLESSHKLCKLYRRAFSQKSSRSKTNRDIFHRLLLQSDIFISLLNVVPKKMKQKIPTEVLSMLTDCHLDVCSEDDASSESDSDED